MIRANCAFACKKSRIRRGEAVRHKISRQGFECFLIALLEWSGVSNQNGLVILRSPRENGCNERDANAPPWLRNRLVRLEALLFLFFGKKE